jgi:hypothetical protein
VHKQLGWQCALRPPAFRLQPWRARKFLAAAASNAGTSWTTGFVLLSLPTAVGGALCAARAGADAAAAFMLITGTSSRDAVNISLVRHLVCSRAVPHSLLCCGPTSKHPTASRCRPQPPRDARAASACHVLPCCCCAQGILVALMVLAVLILNQLNELAFASTIGLWLLGARAL